MKFLVLMHVLLIVGLISAEDTDVSLESAPEDNIPGILPENEGIGDDGQNISYMYLPFLWETS